MQEPFKPILVDNRPVEELTEADKERLEKRRLQRVAKNRKQTIKRGKRSREKTALGRAEKAAAKAAFAAKKLDPAPERDRTPLRPMAAPLHYERDIPVEVAPRRGRPPKESGKYPVRNLRIAPEPLRSWRRICHLLVAGGHLREDCRTVSDHLNAALAFAVQVFETGGQALSKATLDTLNERAAYRAAEAVRVAVTGLGYDVTVEATGNQIEVVIKDGPEIGRLSLPLQPPFSPADRTSDEAQRAMLDEFRPPGPAD